MIWILEGDVGRLTRAVLVDSVTETPLPCPAFADSTDAENFLAWYEAGQLERRLTAKERDLARLERVCAAVLLDLHTTWTRERCAECYDVGCECTGCGRRCSDRCARTCPERRGDPEVDRAIDEARAVSS